MLYHMHAGMMQVVTVRRTRMRERRHDRVRMLLLAGPQHQHDMMPGMTMPGMTMAPATKSKAKTAKPARKTAQRQRALRKTKAATKPRTAACSAEHAAMGHCTPTQVPVAMDHGAMRAWGPCRRRRAPAPPNMRRWGIANRPPSA